MGSLIRGLCVLVALGVSLAQAEWKPEYASASADVRQWCRDAELTPAAKKRFSFQKCCDHADVVRTRFRVAQVDGADEWWWLDEGTWRRVPPDVIHWGKHAPDRRPTLFVYRGDVTCFFPGEGGG